MNKKQLLTKITALGMAASMTLCFAPIVNATEVTGDAAGETLTEEQTTEDAAVDPSLTEGEEMLIDDGGEASEEEAPEEETTECRDEGTISHPSAKGNITIDGDSSDWDSITANAGSGYISEWKAALSADGSMLYVMYDGTATSQWDYSYLGYNYALITSNDRYYVIGGWGNPYTVKNSSYADITGASVAVTNEANGSTAGPYCVEMAIPVSALGNMNSKSYLSMAGSGLAWTNVAQVTGEATEEEEAVYEGITIDGSFKDWAAITKTDVTCPNADHTNCLSQVATVWDGDYFYIYIKEGQGGSATIAGTHSNGKFAIVSDLNYESDFQLMKNNTVSGLDGVTCEHVGKEWEICVPASQLPHYTKTLNFAFYEGDTIISGIANLDGSGKDDTFSGITYDGDYEDWTDYPQTTIEYATAGSQNKTIDAKGAVYMDDTNAYAHVKTEIPAHLQEAGGEFLAAVTFNFSDKVKTDYDDRDPYTFRCQFNMIENGRLVTVNEGTHFSDGTYTFQITDLNGDGANGRTYKSMKNKIYGEMTVTIKNGKCDEMELYLSLDKLAQKFNCDKSDLKGCHGHWGRIGHKWVHCEGTSTGPIAGLLLCFGVVAAAEVYRKRKEIFAGLRSAQK